jgi:aminoglycoside phosphotransferase family enzyme
VELGRRLAPRVYEAVLPLTVSRSGHLKLGTGGRAIDYLVKMRRLPAAFMLDSVLSQRPLSSRESTALLAVLRRFFRSARRRPAAPAAYLARLRREIAGNRRSLLLLSTAGCRALIETVHELQRQCLQPMRAELAGRAALLVDGHGDLRPEHVCIKPPVAVIDCLEFDPQLRRMDPLEELAFLALEIERLGHAAQAWALLARFRAGIDDGGSDALAHFYMSRRAGVRARLSAWHIGDPQYPDPRPWQRRTRSYLRDAERHARAALRMLP